MFDLLQCPWAELNYDGILYVQPRDLELKAGEDCRNVKPISVTVSNIWFIWLNHRSEEVVELCEGFGYDQTFPINML